MNMYTKTRVYTRIHVYDIGINIITMGILINNFIRIMIILSKFNKTPFLFYKL